MPYWNIFLVVTLQIIWRKTLHAIGLNLANDGFSAKWARLAAGKPSAGAFEPQRAGLRKFASRA
jgi:hypothetical protein